MFHVVNITGRLISLQIDAPTHKDMYVPWVLSQLKIRVIGMYEGMGMALSLLYIFIRFMPELYGRWCPDVEIMVYPSILVTRNYLSSEK